MTLAKDDLLLKFGKGIALMLQALCVLGGSVFFLVIVVVTLMSVGMLPGLVDAKSLPDVAKYPLLTAGIGFTVMANFAAMFFFFGKMRTLIESASKGDPFIPDNARRLNAMAWLLLVHEVVAVLVGELRVYLANLVDEQGRNTIDYSPYDLNGVLIVIVLFILARIFKIGAAMREDLKGTV